MSPDEVCANFPAVGPVGSAVRLDGGHIHDTWLVTGGTGRWIVQRCNTTVFTRLDAVMANIAVVSTVVPEMAHCPARDGSVLWRDAAGDVWRVRPYVEGDGRGDREPGADLARELGRGLGAFHRRVAAIDPLRLAVTVPGFHDPVARLAALERLGDVGPIDRFRWLAEEAYRLQSPAVPLRVAHFDAKADNFLFDPSGRVRALIDLDTVMPGSWLWDVGDLARSATGTTGEDEPDGMTFDLSRFDAIVDGYRTAVDGLLCDAERGGLRVAPMVVTFEQAVRFLADHLAGDVYYRVSRPDQNLDRATAQLRLLESMVAALG
ncbi:MAG: phosphotransferase enzyme family protein [Acidimicrobiales bacterium]